MASLTVKDHVINPSHPGLILKPGAFVESDLIQSLPVESLIMGGLRSIISPEKTAKIADVFRSGMCPRQYSLAEVSEHCDPTSCWIVISDKVYDVTEFISKHPGGVEIILEHAGHDATVPFESKGHSLEAYSMVKQYLIGELTEDDRRFKSKKEDK